MIRNSRPKVLLKYGGKGPLKKLRHLGLTLRKGTWRFPSWLRAWADWRQYQDVWGHLYEGRASSSGSSRKTSPVSEPLRLNFEGWLYTPNVLTLSSRSVRKGGRSRNRVWENLRMLTEVQYSFQRISGRNFQVRHPRCVQWTVIYKYIKI